MPDLSRTAVLTWLLDQEARIATLWGEPIRLIEDDAEVAGALERMGKVLDHSLNGNATNLSALLQEQLNQLGLRRILVQLGPARLLRLLHWLSAAGLSEAGKVLGGLLRDEPSGVGRMLREAIQETHRQELLARLFSRGRLDTLLAACQAQGEAA